MSLRHRLLGVLLLAAFVTTLTATGATWYWALREIDEILDYQLRQQALSLEDKAYLLGSVTVFEPSPEQHFVTQLWDRRGVLRYQSHHEVQLGRPTRFGYSTVHEGQEAWRVYAMELGPWIVQLAHPLSIRNEIANSAALRMLYPTLGILPLLALLIWWTVGRVLAPLSVMSSAIARRDPAQLTPLPVAGLPLEVALMATALNDLMARLQATLARQQEFMADAAHELRTPLTAVRLQLQLLERAGDGEEETREEALSELKRGVARAALLVERLLAIARLDASGAREGFQELDFPLLIRRIAQELTPLVQSRRVELRLDLAPELKTVGEERSLQALVENLLENAVRYTPESGQVCVTLQRGATGAAVLEVDDSGPGIPLAEREKIFERFYRVSGTRPPGSGLGLSIVKRVAERHGAAITVGTSSLGGASFRVSFPPQPTPS